MKYLTPRMAECEYLKYQFICNVNVDFVMIIRERVYLCFTQLYMKYLFLNFRYSVFCNQIMAENVHEIYI